MAKRIFYSINTNLIQLGLIANDMIVKVRIVFMLAIKARETQIQFIKDAVNFIKDQKFLKNIVYWFNIEEAFTYICLVTNG